MLNFIICLRPASQDSAPLENTYTGAPIISQIQVIDPVLTGSLRIGTMSSLGGLCVRYGLLQRLRVWRDQFVAAAGAICILTVSTIALAAVRFRCDVLSLSSFSFGYKNYCRATTFWDESLEIRVG